MNLVVEKHDPLQQGKVSQKYCPWLTTELNKLRKSRDKPKKSANESKSEILMESYRNASNKVNLLKRLRKKYYSSQIQKNVGNLRETWRIANQILNRSSKTTKIDSIKLGDEAITEKRVMSTSIM